MSVKSKSQNAAHKEIETLGKRRAHGAMEAPIGALSRLHNKLLYCVANLTDNEKDVDMGKTTEVTMPSLNKAQDTKAEDIEKRALLFSHLCDQPQELFTLKEGFLFNREMRPRPDVCGVVFDKRTVDEMKKGDVFFDIERGTGNIIAAFVMPFGWNEAKERNEICHNCGSFPARIACQRCSAGRFCTNLCYLQATSGESHSAKVCSEFIKGKVAAAYIRQYDANIEVQQVDEEMDTMENK